MGTGKVNSRTRNGLATHPEELARQSNTYYLFYFGDLRIVLKTGNIFSSAFSQFGFVALAGSRGGGKSSIVKDFFCAT